MSRHHFYDGSIAYTFSRSRRQLKFNFISVLVLILVVLVGLVDVVHSTAITATGQSPAPESQPDSDYRFADKAEIAGIFVTQSRSQPVNMDFVMNEYKGSDDRLVRQSICLSSTGDMSIKCIAVQDEDMIEGELPDGSLSLQQYNEARRRESRTEELFDRTGLQRKETMQVTFMEADARGSFKFAVKSRGTNSRPVRVNPSHWVCEGDRCRWVPSSQSRRLIQPFTASGA